MRCRIAVLIVLSSLLGGVLLAGCGSSDSADAPKAGAMVRSSVLAVGAQRDLKVHYEVDATVRATPAANADAQTRKVLGDPISLTVAGGLSSDAVTADGALGALGRHWNAGARVGPHETFVNLLGVWYADRTQGLGAALGKVKAPADPAKLARTLAQVESNVDALTDATVTAGPDVDGETWQADGRLNPDALATLAADRGEPLTSAQRTVLKAICAAARIRYAVGRSDSLPRRLDVQVSLDEDAVRTLGALDARTVASPEAQVSAVDLHVTVTLTDWGRPVTYEKPAQTRPMDELGGAVMGIVMGAALSLDPSLGMQ